MTARARAAVLTALLAGCADAPAPEAGPETPADAIVLRGVYAGPRFDGAAMRLHHEAVDALGMDAMTMDVAVADAALLDGLAPGAKVSVTLAAEPRLAVTAVDVLPDTTALALAPGTP